jgi:AcrR family transcriptional regulator
MQSASAHRRNREQAFRLELLLEAAEHVFVERGFAGASVEEIARRAGVALATLYKTLPSKEAVFTLVIERRITMFLERVRADSAEGAPVRRLEAVVRATFEFFAAHGNTFRMYLAATQGLPWNIRSGLSEEEFTRYEEFVGYVETLCRAALPTGRRRHARVTALAFVGTLNAVLTEWVARQQPRVAAARVARDTWRVLAPLVVAP